MQASGIAKPPVGIIYDSDLGTNMGSALALSLLYGFDARNEIRLVSLSVSNPDLEAAAYADAVAKFYAAGGFSRLMPIGLGDKAPKPAATPLLTAALDRKNPEGKPLYPHGVQSVNDTAVVGALIRNAMTAQHDENCVIVLAGPASNLAEVLDVRGAREWAERKVKLLAFAGGSFGGGSAEENVKADIKAARRVLAEWPSPIVMAGSELGQATPLPASMLTAELAWAEAHPVVDSWKTAPADVPSHEMSAALYAVRPQEGYFKLSEPGTIEVADDGTTRFTPSASGRHRHLISDPAQNERILAAYKQLVSQKPVPKQRPFPPPVQNQEQKKPEEKPAAKPQG